MNTFLWIFLNLFLFSLKTHWFLLFTTYDSPDFLLLLLILYALDQGGRKGALYGIGMGLFLDVVSFGYFGYHLVTRALVGAFIDSNRMNVFADRMPTYMVLTALVTLLLGVVRGLFLCVMLHRWMPFVSFALWTLRSIGWNLVMAPIVWIIYQKVKERLLRRHSYYYHL